MKKEEFHVTVTKEGITALELLSSSPELFDLKLSKQKLKHIMQQGCIWLESKKQKGSIQRVRRAKKVLGLGDVLHFYYDENVLAMEPQAATLVVDKGDYSVWDKPAGLLSQGSKWGDHCTIQRWAEKKLQPERAAFVVHRLDRAASGLIILAHKKNVAAKFSELFEQRLLEKIYKVTVEGNFSTVIPEGKKQLTIDAQIDGKIALSHAAFMSYNSDDNTSILKVQIETGRKHQIRKHLSGLGFPVLGDRLYGAENQTVDLQLKAVSLKFICPVTGLEKLYSVSL